MEYKPDRSVYEGSCLLIGSAGKFYDKNSVAKKDCIGNGLYGIEKDFQNIAQILKENPMKIY
jgi:hypothetical protein